MSNKTTTKNTYHTPALKVCAWIINRGIETKHKINPLKLNKLLYFAHGFCYKNEGCQLLYNKNGINFEVWEYGPINPEAYYTFEEYGLRAIKERQNTTNINIEVHKYLTIFWQKFAIHETTTRLQSMANAKNFAWYKAKQEELSYIPEEYIKEDFTQNKNQ